MTTTPDIDKWPPLKMALWRVLMDEKLNDGHYIKAFDLIEKLHTAAIGSVGPAQGSPERAFSAILHELKGLVSEGNETRDRCRETDPNDQQGAAIRSAYIKGLNKAISIVLLARKAALAAQPPAAPVETDAMREALDNSQSLLAMIGELGDGPSPMSFSGITTTEWDAEGLTKLIADQLKENRAALGEKTACRFSAVTSGQEG